MQDVIDMARCKSFTKAKTLDSKLIRVRMQVTDDTIVNLSLLLGQNFIFPNNAQGNDKLKNATLSSQCHSTFGYFKKYLQKGETFSFNKNMKYVVHYGESFSHLEGKC